MPSFRVIRFQVPGRDETPDRFARHQIGSGLHQTGHVPTSSNRINRLRGSSVGTTLPSPKDTEHERSRSIRSAHAGRLLAAFFLRVHLAVVEQVALAGDPIAVPPRKADEAPKAKERRKIDLGRDLFVREWIPNDKRSHGGDGFGPVYNERRVPAAIIKRVRGAEVPSTRTSRVITAGSMGGDRSGSTGLFLRILVQLRRRRIRIPDWRLSPNIQIGPPAAPRPDLVALMRIHPGFRNAPSVVLHRYGNDGDYRVWREWVFQQHGAVVLKTSQRNPIPLFGAGLIDKIPEAVIEAGVRRKHPGSPRVNGRASRLDDGRIGRFGWKAQTASLRKFNLSAAAVEMGLEVPGHAQAADPRCPRSRPPAWT